jgi:hypothetical protein
MLRTLFLGAALFTALSAPALAQNVTLSKGQMVDIRPDGRVTVLAMPKDAKTQKTMARASKAMAQGTIIWMDANGRVHQCAASLIQDIRLRESL